MFPFIYRIVVIFETVIVAYYHKWKRSLKRLMEAICVICSILIGYLHLKMIDKKRDTMKRASGSVSNVCLM